MTHSAAPAGFIDSEIVRDQQVSGCSNTPRHTPAHPRACYNIWRFQTVACPRLGTRYGAMRIYYSCLYIVMQVVFGWLYKWAIHKIRVKEQMVLSVIRFGLLLYTHSQSEVGESDPRGLPPPEELNTSRGPMWYGYASSKTSWRQQ